MKKIAAAPKDHTAFTAFGRFASKKGVGETTPMDADGYRLGYDRSGNLLRMMTTAQMLKKHGLS